MIKKWIGALALAIVQVGAVTAHAQAVATPQEKAAARADRKVEGTAAARSFQPGEGDPKPAPHAAVSASERAAARNARRAGGAAAAKAPQAGEGDPIPEAKAKIPAQERIAERRASRAEVKRENKAGELPVFGEGYGAK